jgi:hypothetical protein
MAALEEGEEEASELKAEAAAVLDRGITVETVVITLVMGGVCFVCVYAVLII